MEASWRERTDVTRERMLAMGRRRSDVSAAELMAMAGDCTGLSGGQVMATVPSARVTVAAHRWMEMPKPAEPIEGILWSWIPASAAALWLVEVLTCQGKLFASVGLQKCQDCWIVKTKKF